MPLLFLLYPRLLHDDSNRYEESGVGVCYVPRNSVNSRFCILKQKVSVFLSNNNQSSFNPSRAGILAKEVLLLFVLMVTLTQTCPCARHDGIYGSVEV